MITKAEYIVLKAKEDLTDEEKATIKAYENGNNIIDDNSYNEHIAKSVNNDNNNTVITDNNIDTLHEQNPQQLEEKLIKKEKGADYQKAQKVKRENEEAPTEDETAKGGFLAPLTVLIFLVGAFILFIKKSDKKGVKTTLNSKKTAPTENGTGNSNGKPERETVTETGTLKGVFNG